MNTLDISELAAKLRPHLGDKIDKLFLEYSLAEDAQRRQEIYQIIVALYSRYVDDKILEQNTLLKMPEVNSVAGNYSLAKINYPNKKPDSFGLRDKDWIRHVCVTGMSGSGKTTFAMRILKNFIVKKNPFMVFDWKKSFRQLLYLSKDILIFTVGKPNASNLFRLNINKPPKNVSPDEWITIIADLLCESYGASFGVHKLLTEVMQKAFKDFGVYAGSDNYPTWYQIRDRLKELAENRGKSRESEWLASALRIAHGLTFGEFGNTINDKASYNLSIEELLENQIVFELDALGTSEKKFFSSFMLLYVYKYRKNNSTSIKNGFNNAIIVDEAHNIFLKKRTNFVDESITDTIYREIREYGVGLICLDQHASKLSDTVLGNSSTHIAFQQILPADVDSISRLMFLYDRRNIFTRLKVGQAVVKLTDRFYDPFLIEVNMLDLNDKIVDDSIIRGLVKENCVFAKKKKLWNELSNTKRLATEIERVKDIYLAVGLNPKEDSLKKQVRIKQEVEDALEADSELEKKKAFLVSHVQQDIYEDIKKVLSQKSSITEAKKYFKSLGYQNGDILKAFKVFSQTKEGKLIYKYFELISSYSKKFTKIDKIESLNFLRKLQITGENLSTTNLYRELNISVRKGNDIKNIFSDIGLIDICEERTTKGITKKIRFTDDGRKFMEKLGTTA